MENGYWESFNARLRDELLNGETFYSLAEAKAVIEGWRRHYNAIRPHSALGARLQAARAGGRAMAGCATPTSSTGHTNRRVSAAHELTLQPDHSMGADH